MKDRLDGGPIIGIGSLFLPIANLLEDLLNALGLPEPRWLQLYLINFQWPF